MPRLPVGDEPIAGGQFLLVQWVAARTTAGSVLPLTTCNKAREPLPKDKTITISIIAGPWKGLTRQFNKPRISIGRAGGGADIEIDDPTVSRLHCAVGVMQGRIRLCDLDSKNGTYVNDARVQAADLEHLSDFRVGSSVFLATILPKREMGPL